jgi:hypothetical protein
MYDYHTHLISFSRAASLARRRSLPAACRALAQIQVATMLAVISCGNAPIPKAPPRLPSRPALMPTTAMHNL